MNIADIIDNCNSSVLRANEEAFSVLIPLFEKEFTDYRVKFSSVYQGFETVWFFDGERRIRMNIGASNGDVYCRRSPHGTHGEWTQEEVNVIKER
ncbi:MAG: hypothetical protein RR370_03420, partial [Synergistaceae bacterium]